MSYKGPSEVVKDLTAIGMRKSNLSTTNTLILSVLAGIYIAVAGQAMIMVTFDTGSIGAGLTRFVAGTVFSLGLILVILGGAELFTGNTLMSVCCFTGIMKAKMMLRNWSLVYFGNFVGSILIVLLVYYSGVWQTGDNAVGKYALKIAISKVQLDFWTALLRGIGANWLVCVAVWLALSGSSTMDKVLGIYFPIVAFIILGFEHSIANMYFLPMGIFLKQSLAQPGMADLTISSAVFNNLIPVTIGNVIGGVFFVALPYWFVYMRNRDETISIKEKKQHE